MSQGVGFGVSNVPAISIYLCLSPAGGSKSLSAFPDTMVCSMILKFSPLKSYAQVNILCKFPPQ